tara:strand:- start:262 stop:501 length:240 start_codon:yes stop_codon:yes gene_type:complete
MMNVNVELEHGRKETVEEFLARGKKIEKSEKVLGAKSLNLFSKYSANYRGGSGKTRMGKNGSGKARMSEAFTSIKHLSV